MFCVNLSSLPSYSWYMTVCSVVCLLSFCIVSNIGRWSEFSAWIVVLLYSEDQEMLVVDVRCLAL